MPFLYFKHIIYEIWGETGLKNVNSRDSNRYFWQLYSHNLILRNLTYIVLYTYLLMASFSDNSSTEKTDNEQHIIIHVNNTMFLNRIIRLIFPEL